MSTDGLDPGAIGSRPGRIEKPVESLDVLGEESGVVRGILRGSVFVLAAAGCQARPSTIPLGGDEGPQTSSASPEESSGTSRQAEELNEAAPGTTSSEGNEQPEDTEESPTAPTASDAPVRSESEPSSSCSEASAEPGDCAKLQHPVEACAAALPLREYCSAANHLLRPAVARAYYDCVDRYDGTEALCAPALQEDCLLEATRASCAPPSFQRECRMLVRDCPKIPAFLRKNCMSILGSMKKDQVHGFVECLERCDVAACLASRQEPAPAVPRHSPGSKRTE